MCAWHVADQLQSQVGQDCGRFLYAIGTNNRKEMRAELEAMEHEITMLRNIIKQMEIADEQAAGHVDD
jgi:hypothetical protein